MYYNIPMKTQTEFLGKVYKNEGFKTRIQINLANISSSENDEYKIVSVYYDWKGFTCELCSHQHCLYAFTIKNLKTDINITIGSECINHFKDKGVDLDMAEGLIKRIMKATAEARKKMVDDLGQELYDKLPDTEKATIRHWQIREKIQELGKAAVKAMGREEKAKRTVEAYTVIQAIELLADVAGNKHIMSKEEIQHVIDLGLEDKLNDAEKRAQRNKMNSEYLNISREVNKYIYELRSKSATIDPTIQDAFIERAKVVDTVHPGYTNAIIRYFDGYKREMEGINQFEWILKSSNTSPILMSLKAYLLKYKTLSSAQVTLAKSILDGNNIDPTFQDKLDFITKKSPSGFIFSVSSFFKQRGYVSPKQKDAVMKIYDDLIKKETK